MSEHWTEEDWLLIVRGLSELDHSRDRDDVTADRILELQRQIAIEQGFSCPSEFVRKAESERPW